MSTNLQSTRCSAELFEQAVADCVDHAKRTKREKLWMIVGDEVWIKKEGDDMQVKLDLFSDKIKMIASAGRGVIVHSHPQFDPLSPQDIGLATAWEHEVWAVTVDGGRYASTGYLRPPQQNEDVAISETLSKTIGPIVKVAMDDERVNDDERIALFAHLTNVELSDAGLLDYRYQIGDRLQMMLGLYEEKWRQLLREVMPKSLLLGAQA